MWHALNAYERGDEIVADFVGYDAPDHFIGSDPAFAAIMEGRVTTPKHRGRLRRYIIDPQAGRVREETLADANVEFPMIRTDLACRQHRFGYVTVSAGSTIFHDGVARIDTETGQVGKYHFGEGIHAGEPIFAPKPGASDNPADADAGWLRTVGLDGNTGSSFLAIFDAENVSAGPLAIARLTHQLPLSFHGCWVTRT